MAARTLCLVILSLVFAFSATSPAQSTQPNNPPANPNARHLRILSIGNSFSHNATGHLYSMTKAMGDSWTIGQAWINGASFERHLIGARAFEANPNDKAGRPYSIKQSDGTMKKFSLSEMITANEWDYVVIQQSSILSFDINTYRPHAKDLVDYVHKYAPDAKIVIHETWTYRADHPLFSDGKMTQQKMYDGLHAAYETIAAEVGAVGIIPVGTAFQTVRVDPEWGEVVPTPMEIAALKPPELPKDHSLNRGYSWPRPSTQPTTSAASTRPIRLGFDGIHVSTAGYYLGSAVWYEFFYGDLESHPFVPKDVSTKDYELMKKVAIETVAKNPHPLKVSKVK